MKEFFASAGKELTPERIKAVREELSRSGPGEVHHRKVVDPPVHLTQRGRQPLTLREPAAPRTDREVLVFDGRLFNTSRTETTLDEPGSGPRGNGHAGRMLNVLRDEGVEGLKRVQGMFSFVYWNPRQRRFIAARDAVGHLPLYYSRTRDDGLEVSTSLAALLGGTSRKADPASLSWYLSLGYVPSPRTAFFEIKSVPPGHYLLWEDGAVRDQVKYHDPLDDLTGNPSGTEPEAFPRRLSEVLERRLEPSVTPVVRRGEGIASRRLVRVLSKRGRKVVVCGLRFPGEERRPPEEGTAYGPGKVMRKEFRVEPELHRRLPEVIGELGNPLADPSVVSGFALARRMAKPGREFLSTVGGRELFGPCGRYDLLRRVDRWSRFLPSPLRPLVAGLGRSFPTGDSGGFMTCLSLIDQTRAARLAKLVGTGGDRYKSKLGKGPLKEPARRGGEQWLGRWFRRLESVSDPGDQAMAVDLVSRLPGSDLLSVSAGCRVHGLSWQAPYLDEELVKGRLRRVNRSNLGELTGSELPIGETESGEIPASEGFEARFRLLAGRWFREEPEAEYLKEKLLGSHDGMDRIVDREIREDLYKKMIPGHEGLTSLLWALVMLRIWMETFDVRL